MEVPKIVELVFSHDSLLTGIVGVAVFYLQRMQRSFEEMGRRQAFFNEQLIKLESRIVSEIEILKAKTSAVEKRLDNSH